MRSTNPTFGRLLAPIAVDAFFDTWWERDYLHIARNIPGYYAYALTLQSVDRLIDSRDTSTYFLRAVHAGRHFEAGAVDMRGLYREGATLVLNHAETAVPSLSTLCSALEAEIQCHVQANLYMTPPGSAGFPPHYDTHGVFVLQVHGHKEWRLYDTPVDLVTQNTPIDPADYTNRVPRVILELAPGDLLYIPRGMVHCARTKDTSSIHATIGPIQADWAALIPELARQAAVDPAFRRLLPHGMSSFADKAVFAKEFAQAMAALIERTDLATLSASFVQGRRQKHLARVSDLVNVDRLDTGSVVQRRPQLEVRVIRKDQWVTLQFNSEELSLPAFLTPALDSILGDAPFAVGDIQAIPSEAGRVALARRFLKAGLLTVVSLNERGSTNARARDDRGTARPQGNLGDAAIEDPARTH
jgi:ribosomal protein L16 Arg81 hydroxylase